MEIPLVDKDYVLEKFPGKGGWVYAAIPEIAADKHAHFGWVRVRGTIDGFELKRYRLMPMGNGNMFLPVRAEIRKKIGKKEGDSVRVVLYADNGPAKLPEDVQLCLQDEPDAYKTFTAYTEAEQHELIDWIESARNEAMRIARIAQTINKLSSHKH